MGFFVVVGFWVVIAAFVGTLVDDPMGEGEVAGGINLPPDVPVAAATVGPVVCSGVVLPVASPVVSNAEALLPLVVVPLSSVAVPTVRDLLFPVVAAAPPAGVSDVPQPLHNPMHNSAANMIHAFFMTVFLLDTSLFSVYTIHRGEAPQTCGFSPLAKSDNRQLWRDRRLSLLFYRLDNQTNYTENDKTELK